jgi:hypothetical protein
VSTRINIFVLWKLWPYFLTLIEKISKKKLSKYDFRWFLYAQKTQAHFAIFGPEAWWTQILSHVKAGPICLKHWPKTFSKYIDNIAYYQQKQIHSYYKTTFNQRMNIIMPTQKYVATAWKLAFLYKKLQATMHSPRGAASQLFFFLNVSRRTAKFNE